MHRLPRNDAYHILFLHNDTTVFSDGFLSFLPGNEMLGSPVTYLDMIKELTFDDTAFEIFNRMIYTWVTGGSKAYIWVEVEDV